MNARAANAVRIPTQFGTPFAGGFYGGRLTIAGVLYALVFAPKAEGEKELPLLKDYRKKVTGALSYSDGPANTQAFADAGSEAAQWALGLEIGGEKGWHIPSRLQALVLFGERDDAGDAAARFRPGGDEAFEEEWHWTSTQYAANASYAWIQSFDYGGQTSDLKGLDSRVRAVRLVPVIQ